MLRYIVAPLVILAFVGFAQADFCRVRVVHAAPVVHHNAYAVQAVAVPVYQQAYPYVASYSDPALLQIVDKLLVQNRELVQELRASGPLQSKAPTPQVESLRANPEGLKILQTKCAGCHNQQKQSGGLALFDASGQLIRLNCEQREVLDEKCFEQKMPPKNSGIEPLTDQEYAAIRSVLKSMK